MSESSITVLLHQWQRGDEEALHQLIPLVYGQLRKIARRRLASSNAEDTIRSTELVHEAYLRLAGAAHNEWNDRAHFYAVAARAMRSVLIDQARGRSRQKRGGGAARLTFDEALVASGAADGRIADSRILDLEESLQRLEKLDPRKARITELIFFGGLTQQETAQFIHVSEATVERDLKLAKAWLHRDLKR
jgi:RNA polymerase sigma factor (TIGR02999 family)